MTSSSAVSVARFRPVTRADRDRLLTFARELPLADLLFLRRDIRRPEEVDRWLSAAESGRAWTTLAVDAEDRILGYVVLDRGDLPWRNHVGELRVLVAEAARRAGVGYALLQRGFEKSLDFGLHKLVVRLAPTQKSAQATVENLGFRWEARLRDHLRDTGGQLHDLLIYSLLVGTQPVQRCEDCLRSAPLGPSLEGRALCWECYGLRAMELGRGD